MGLRLLSFQGVISIGPLAWSDRGLYVAGSSGFMLFRTSDHGALLHPAGQMKQDVQCLVGNPLLAIPMTEHEIRRAAWSTTSHHRCWVHSVTQR